MSLPAEKAVTTAVIVGVPESVRAVFDDIRAVHDKAYARWPPHINLLFPFVPERHFAEAAAIVQRALSDLAPFTLTFAELAHFTHARSVTLYAKPTADRPEALVKLQAALERAFPFCDDQGAKSSEGFTAHLTLGQFTSSSAAARFISSLTWTPLTVHVDAVQLIARSPQTGDRMTVRHSVPLGSGLIAQDAPVEESSGPLVRSVLLDTSLSAAESAACARVLTWLKARHLANNAPRSLEALSRAVQPLCVHKANAATPQQLLDMCVAEGLVSVTGDVVAYPAPSSSRARPLGGGSSYNAPSERVQAEARVRQWLSAHATKPRSRSALLQALSQLAVVSVTVDVTRVLDALVRAGNVTVHAAPSAGAASSSSSLVLRF